MLWPIAPVMYILIPHQGSSLEDQWLTLPSSAGGQGAGIPGALWPKKKKNQNIKQKQYCTKFNKDFKNGPYQKKKI